MRWAIRYRPWGRWHLERERIVAESGIPVTVLRPGGFMTNALAWAETIRSGGVVLDPTGPGRYAPIDPVDIVAWRPRFSPPRGTTA
ncbi:SDR family oxidoreductase [Nocardia sp. CA-135953]|uniref:SDR family oxidoreductase n=1 Tax=Nocardia sp. CA-135953 TaxID=3239978 RepID=UPI003D96D345